MSEDQRLLHDYAALGSRQALEELIRRHLALVYSAALRQVRDPHLAEDVTQAVFLVLSERAKSIRNGVAVGGWLLSVTRYTSVNAMKKRSIQRMHEMLAARPESAHAMADPWEDIAPRLDDELSRLGRSDRDAIVLRFFQDRSFAQIGSELGLSEDAARKRVSRAVDRLRGRLARQSPAITVAVLSGAIASRAVCAAEAIPNHLVAGTIAACAGNPTPYCVLLAKGAIKMIAWTKVKLIGAVAACVLFGGTGVFMMTRAVAQQAGDAAQNQPASPTPGAVQVVVRLAGSGQPSATAQRVVVAAPSQSTEAAVNFSQPVIVALPANQSQSAEAAQASGVPVVVSVPSTQPSR